MAARLAQVEQANRRLSEKNAEQAQELESLRMQLDIALQPDQDQAEGSAAASVEVRVLRAERDRLKTQVEGMANFLADYGLKWTPPSEDTVMGDADAVAESGRAAKGQPSPGPTPRAQKTPDRGEASVNVNVLKERVQSLNEELEDQRSGGIVKNIPGAKGAQLAGGASDPIPVTFFGDGVKVGNRAFLSYATRPAQGLIKDILDGNFPHMLREEFPDGTPLSVVDRTKHVYRIWVRDLAAYDTELAEGGERLRPSVGCAVRNPRDLMNNAERFVDKLPERVLRNGKVCEVKGPLAERLGVDVHKGGAPGNAGNVAATAGGGNGAGSGPGGRRASSGSELSLLDAGRNAAVPAVRLQIKLDGGQKLMVRAEAHTTIGSLWDAVAAWGKEHGMPFVGADGKLRALRTAFPPRTYKDRAETLQAAGLTPSATLFVATSADAEDDFLS